MGQVGALYRKSRVSEGREGLVGSPRLPCLVSNPSHLFGQEKRKRQAEIDGKRRQLEDDRRQLQHLKVPVSRAWPRQGWGSGSTQGS